MNGRSARFHKISHPTEVLGRLLVEPFLKSRNIAPDQIVLNLNAPRSRSSALSRTARLGDVDAN